LKCDFCGREEDLPFTCNYCGGTFCGEHRLPEAHACTGDLTRRVVANPTTTTRSWDTSEFSGTSGGRSSSPYRFSPKEVRDILIAWSALALAFTIADCGLSSGRGCPISGGPGTFFFVSFIAVGSGFVLHELMHKFTAERYGYWAEFRMWVMGIVLALITSTLGFIFAAPGATYISGANVTDRQNGIISLAGPATNVVIAVIFLLVGLVGNGIANDIGLIGFQVNLFLALFNMLPIMPLDGAKVFHWKKVLWAAVFFPLLLGVVFVFF
jgi:Zn-dependent protease